MRLPYIMVPTLLAAKAHRVLHSFYYAGLLGGRPNINEFGPYEFEP